MTVLSDLVERTRNAARDRPSRDSFNGAVLTADTAITLLGGDKIPVGGIIDTASFETMRVLTKPTVTTATVERQIEGTTAVQYSSGADVFIGFRYSYASYRRAVNNALAAISLAFGNPTWDSSGIFGTKQYIYAVPPPAIRVIDVMYIPSSVQKLKHVPFRFEPSVPAAAGVVAGPAVILDGYNPGTGAVYIHYEKPWTPMVAASDALDAAYPAHAEDCIVTGAIAYLSDEEAFRRVAFDSPHGKQQVFATGTTEADNASRENLQRFLTRRAELASLLRRVNTTWVKG